MERTYNVEIGLPSGIVAGYLYVRSASPGEEDALAAVYKLGEAVPWVSAQDRTILDALHAALNRPEAQDVVIRIRHKAMVYRSGLQVIIDLNEEFYGFQIRGSSSMYYRFSTTGKESEWRSWADVAIQKAAVDGVVVCCGTCAHAYSTIYGGADDRFALSCFRKLPETLAELKKFKDEEMLLPMAEGPFEVLHVCPAWTDGTSK